MRFFRIFGMFYHPPLVCLSDRLIFPLGLYSIFNYCVHWFIIKTETHFELSHDDSFEV